MSERDRDEYLPQFGLILPVDREGFQTMLHRATYGLFYSDIEVPRNWVVVEPFTYAYRVNGRWKRFNWLLMSNSETIDNIHVN